MAEEASEEAAAAAGGNELSRPSRKMENGKTHSMLAENVLAGNVTAAKPEPEQYFCILQYFRERC